jgi:hypothetical protein
MHLRIFVFYLIILFTSCSKLIDDSFEDYSPTLVLVGILEADSIISVHVGATANLSDGLPMHIENAVVIVSSLNYGSDTLSHVANGNYISLNKANAGEAYFCVVHAEGYKSVSAQTSVPRATDIKNLNYTEKALRNENGEILSSVDFYIQNDNSKKLFWEVDLVSVGQFDTSWNSHEFSKTYDHSIYFFAEQNQVLLNEANPLNLFSNNKIEGANYNVKFYFRNNNLTEFYGKDRADSTFIVLKSVDYSYYQYIKQYYVYQTGKEPKFGYSAKYFPLFSNVENGYGIFASYTSNWQRYAFANE